jgi:hypothetical protein
LACAIDGTPVTDDLAAVGVHLHRDNRKVKTLAIVIKVHLDVDEGVTHAFPV